jgi:hypothetical protein
MNRAYSEVIAAAERDRRDLFVSTARQLGIAEQNVEKDFWVCWTLDALFHGRRAEAPRLLFKGGTSLSKAFGLISRFSEDIDITVFRQDLGSSISIDELENMSGKKRQATLEGIRTACQSYLQDQLLPDLQEQFLEVVDGRHLTGVGVSLDQGDPDGQTVLLAYPSVFASDMSDSYVRSVVRIECGAKSALDPHVEVTIRPYVSDDLRSLNLTVEGITTIQPARTFWDKVVILHGLHAWYAKRGELRQQGQRISRHYYDLHVMFRQQVGEEALADLALGHECVRHARMFFSRPDYNLAAAADGDFAIRPVGDMLSGLRRDYAAMTGMVFGPTPSFDEIVESIASIEERLRAERTPIERAIETSA